MQSPALFQNIFKFFIRKITRMPLLSRRAQIFTTFGPKMTQLLQQIIFTETPMI